MRTEVFVPIPDDVQAKDVTVSLYTAADAAGALTCAREKSAASGGSCGKTFGQVGLIDKEADQRCIITLIKRDAGRL
ncbi:unnamed protein product [Cladocopium goreaui]|uniref:Uncharacterized protein n=1 Tax=Cladocopium goreaui TaxID=2562237 RepID=A0A9P1GE54_9DINO|nr:unnamed protein product [Cladocopium goreaui]